MAAHADDLRYFYAAHLGPSVTFSVTDAGSTKVAEQLSPGRYLVYPIDLTGRIWVRQGPFADVTATQGVPSTPMDADSLRAIELTVRQGRLVSGSIQNSDGDGIAAIGAVGGSCTLVVVKISRGKS